MDYLCLAFKIGKPSFIHFVHAQGLPLARGISSPLGSLSRSYRASFAKQKCDDSAAGYVVLTFTKYATCLERA